MSSLYLNFQPDLSNRLVVERGPERYSVHLSLNLVTSLGMYDNAGQMSISDPPTPSGYVLPLLCLSREGKQMTTLHLPYIVLLNVHVYVCIADFYSGLS